MASEKRKDKFGRILKTGESVRPNGTYVYKYQSKVTGKREAVYAKTLKELREKEEEINKHEVNNVNYFTSQMTLLELYDVYMNLNSGLKANSIRRMRESKKRITGLSIADTEIRYIKEMEAKTALKELENTYSYQTIATTQDDLRAAYNMAIRNDIVSKNPFSFSLKSIIKDTTKEKIPYTEEQIEIILQYCKERNLSIYDTLVVLFDTGLRGSEFCGLSSENLNFATELIHVTKQCLYIDGKYSIETLKTKNGNRFIPMTNRCKEILLKHAETSKNIFINDEPINFLFYTVRGNPYKVPSINKNIYDTMNKFRNDNPDIVLPHLSAHICRHTFITNLYKSGMDPKSIIKIVGHSKIDMTLYTYTHIDDDDAIQSFRRYCM